MASRIDRRLGALEDIAALRWWIRAGVTNAIDDMPYDRFGAISSGEEVAHGAPSVPEPQRQTSHGLAKTKSSALPEANWRKTPETAEITARALAQAAPDLETLRLAMSDFEGCALKRTATQLVFADGVPGSRIMFVGEAPGEGEDRTGCPFVGRAGKLLDLMLEAVGLDRQKVYIANVVPWRPPGNRTPTPQETQICLPFIERQIELADPEYLVCLGGSAARVLLGVQGGIMRARGSWLTYPSQAGREIRALAMLHPAFLLRQPAHKRFAWTDMRALAGALKARSR